MNGRVVGTVTFLLCWNVDVRHPIGVSVLDGSLGAMADNTSNLNSQTSQF